MPSTSSATPGDVPDSNSWALASSAVAAAFLAARSSLWSSARDARTIQEPGDQRGDDHQRQHRPQHAVPSAQHRRMPLRVFLGPTFGCRQRFCGFLTVARGLQVGLVAAALLDHALVFAPA